MKNKIFVSFSYGSHSLLFSKTIQLPFPPFYGLKIITNEDEGCEITLKNDDFLFSQIAYDVEKEQFYIYVRYAWRFPITEEEIDETLEQFSDWERSDAYKYFRSKKFNGKRLE